MGKMLEQSKSLGKIILTEEELQAAKFSKGKKVLAILSSTCFYCKATLDSWSESEELKSYLSDKKIKLLFIEKLQSPELAHARGSGEYPNISGYQNGDCLGRRIGLIHADDFINSLKEWYK
ncbi:Uncharacterised protein [uncultured archaeon]|nr:Uncharacterised protein [uncultured archaeon]